MADLFAVQIVHGRHQLTEVQFAFVRGEWSSESNAIEQISERTKVHKAANERTDLKNGIHRYDVRVIETLDDLQLSG